MEFLLDTVDCWLEPQQKRYTRLNHYTRYCPINNDRTTRRSGNYVDIHRHRRNDKQLTIVDVVADKCARRNGEWNKECSCSGLLGDLLHELDTEGNINHIDLQFKAKPAIKGCR